MESQASLPEIIADDVGIHFLGTGRDDIILDWGEIASVDAMKYPQADGSSLLEMYVYHISGVDFRFQDCFVGYDQVMTTMEKHLSGFSRARAEAVLEIDQAIGPPIWTRDETVQPFQLRPPAIDSREPTPEELVQMNTARHASIAICEKILGRALNQHEVDCIQVEFKNGRIVGGIAAPLCNLLIERQAGN
jgi:hypothetical protein